METEASLRRSFAIQTRVVGALLLREVLTRFGRHNIGFLWLLVEPMLFTLAFAAVWYWIRDKGMHGLNLPILPFAITGYSSVILWRNGANKCASAIQPNLALLYHRNVKIIDLFAARLLLEIAGATASLIVLLGVVVLLGYAEKPADLLTMSGGWLLLVWFAVSLGLVVGMLAQRSDSFQRFWQMMSYPLFPISGALFMVDWLPPKAQELILWVPMVHGVEMLRAGYYGSAIQAHYSAGYLAMVNLIMLWFGLQLLDRTSRMVNSE
jgi:capsular polysaccharide transport system permease protein